MASNITPRGFLVGLKKPEKDAELNTTVEKLFFGSLAKNYQHEKMEFRRQAIEAAYEAFGTTFFKEWYDHQKDSPYFTEMHQDFLRDTLQFLETGERKFHLETWDALLSRDCAEKATETDYNEIEVEFFGLPQAGIIRKVRPYRLPDLICKWTKQEEGFQDLIYTLFILFGKPYQRER